jgi:RNA polymerase sigma-70 factor, ECF subfamily
MMRVGSWPTVFRGGARPREGAAVFANPPSPEEVRERDLVWVEGMRSGEEVSFERIFQTYFDRLQAYAERYVRQPEAAEEVVANVFVRLWQQRAELHVRDSLKSYLYTAVRNQALMWIEHEKVVSRTREVGEREHRSPGMGQAPAAADEQMQALELADALELVIERMPPRVRDAYVLSRQHGLSYAQVAEEMQISPKTVEIHLGRALKLLRAELAAFMR